MKHAPAYGAVMLLLFFLLFCLPGLAAQSEEMVLEEESTEEVIHFAETEEDLAEGYIVQVLYSNRPSGVKRAPRLIGSRLEGVNRKLYAGLYEGIVQAAAGLRESTVFSFSFEDLYEQRTFTAEELGIEAILVDGKLCDEAKEKAKSMMTAPDYSAINRALLADCPYELYWFNKVDGGMRISTSRSYRATSAALTVNGTITISMTVSQDYAAGTYLLDTSYGQAVTTAAETARSIAAQYADCADAEKLLAYKNEICDRTAYYIEAEEESISYGNPWQLIWVFDENAETRVTCEGYAKAFQYLCDLSSGGVSVISVAGKMNGANHMWNIAAMEDGRNYLIDVTNCDSGMAGYPDGLFLAGAVEGNVHAGYRFFTGSRQLLYEYAEETPFSADELKIAYWSYAQGGPPAPEFRALNTLLYENEQARFDYVDAGYVYDEFTVEIAFSDPSGEETALTELTMYLSGEDTVWAYEPASLAPGSYSFRFAGSRDGGASAWTEQIAVQVGAFEDLVPTYRFSADVGYAGYRAAVRLDQHAEGIYVLETEKEYPCQGQDALIPLNGIGEQAYTLALLWNGKMSAFGETAAITVQDLPQDGVLTVPEGTQVIEEEAFRGISACGVVIPDSVESIEEFAFADNESLRWVEMTAPVLGEGAFANCPNAVFLLSDMDWGFRMGAPFLLQGTEADSLTGEVENLEGGRNTEMTTGNSALPPSGAWREGAKERRFSVFNCKRKSYA